MLSRREFRIALKKGHGRAIMFARQQQPAWITKELRPFLSNDPAYDRQSGDSRGWQMAQLIACAHDPDSLIGRVETSFAAGTIANSDLPHMAEIIVELAVGSGQERLRSLLYQKFDCCDLDDWSILAEPILQLDRAQGATHLLERFAKENYLPDDHLYFVDDEIENILGQEATKNLIHKLGVKNNQFRKYWQEVIEKKQKLAATAAIKKEQFAQSLSLTALSAALEQNNPKFAYRSFARHASQSDLVAVAELIDREEASDVLQNLLRIFWRHPLPLLTERIISLVDSKNKTIRSSAVSALRNNKNDQLHSLAMQILNSNPERVTRRGDGDPLELLALNYQPGDHEMIESLLQSIQNQHIIHSIGLSILRICDNNPSAELAGLLHYLYEQTPCAVCRADTVKHLIGRNALTEAECNECQFDSMKETREMIKQSALVDKTS